MSRETREAVPVSPEEMRRMLGRDDDDSAVAVLDDEPAPATSNNPDSNDVLQRLLDHFGPDRVLTTDDWRLLLPNPFPVLETAQHRDELSLVVSPWHDKRNRTVTTQGYRVSDVITLLRKKRTTIEESVVLKTLFTLTLAEALPIARDQDFTGNVADKQPVLTVDICVRRLGFDGDQLEAAIAAGKLRSPDGSWQHAGRITFDALRAWVEADNIKPTWSADIAFRVFRQRRDSLLSQADRERAAKRDELQAVEDATNPIHGAFDQLEESKEIERQEAIAGRRQQLAAYREILLRRKSPLPSDAMDLGQLCTELNCEFADAKDTSTGKSIAAQVCKSPGCDHQRFDRARVLDDAETLDRAEQLEQLATTIEACRKEIEAAGEANKALLKRHEIEADASRKRVNKAFEAMRYSGGAPADLRELHKNNPVLFKG